MTTDEVFEILEGMCVHVRLEVKGYSTSRYDGQLEQHQKDFIEKNYLKIRQRLLDEATRGK